MAVPILKSKPHARTQVTASGLQVVTYGRDLKFFCRVPGCDARFYEDEERPYIAHVTSCAQRHERELREMELGQQMPGIFGPEAGDQEKKTWYRDRKGWKV